MLRCHQLTERVTDYLERQLPVSEKLNIFLHLSRCRDCRSYLEQMKRTVRLLRQLPAPRCSGEVSDDLMARFRRARLPPLPRHGAGGLRLVSANRDTGARPAVKDGP